MIRRLAAQLPPGVVRLVGRLQYRVPPLRRLMLRLDAALTEGETTIAHGVGAGLRFDAAGGHPGYALGTSEPDEQEWLERALSPGDVVYDVGANVGFLTVIAARLVGAGGAVWAFEPAPRSAERLRRNAERNGFDHVHVVETALGAERGRMGLTRDADGGDTHYRLAPAGEGPDVDVAPLDEWRAQQGAPPPDLLKIDVEGFELDVLTGARETLRAHRPKILCEVHGLGAAFFDFVDRELEPLGYRVTTLSGAEPDRVSTARWHAVLE